MQDNLVYAPVAAVVALTCIATAITGKFRRLRNSEKGWPVSKRWRWLLAIVGVIAAFFFLLAFVRR